MDKGNCQGVCSMCEQPNLCLCQVGDFSTANGVQGDCRLEQDGTQAEGDSENMCT